MTENNAATTTTDRKVNPQHRNSSIDTPKWVAVRELLTSGASTPVNVVSIASNGAGRTCGLNVTINGLDAFLPGSELPKGVNQQELVGQTIAVKVIEVNRRKGRLIVSRKTLAVEEQTAFIAGLVDVAEVTGTIARKSPFGYFINLGLVDGLLHISQIPLDGDTEKELTIGDTVTLRIREVDTEKGKVGLSMLEAGVEDNRGGRNFRGNNRGGNGGNRGGNGGGRNDNGGAFGSEPRRNTERFARRQPLTKDAPTVASVATPMVVATPSAPRVLKVRSTSSSQPKRQQFAFEVNSFAGLAAAFAARDSASTEADPVVAETPTPAVEQVVTTPVVE